MRLRRRQRNWDSDFGEHDFADPGGRSALRASYRGNPRNRSCPDCGARNVLTPADRALGYCCNICADRNEGRYGAGSYGDY